eukprot:gene14132-biopygen1895
MVGMARARWERPWRGWYVRSSLRGYRAAPTVRGGLAADRPRLLRIGIQVGQFPVRLVAVQLPAKLAAQQDAPRAAGHLCREVMGSPRLGALEQLPGGAAALLYGYFGAAGVTAGEAAAAAWELQRNEVAAEQQQSGGCPVSPQRRSHVPSPPWTFPPCTCHPHHACYAERWESVPFPRDARGAAAAPTRSLL